MKPCHYYRVFLTRDFFPNKIWLFYFLEPRAHTVCKVWKGGGGKLLSSLRSPLPPFLLSPNTFFWGKVCVCVYFFFGGRSHQTVSFYLEIGVGVGTSNFLPESWVESPPPPPPRDTFLREVSEDKEERNLAWKGGGKLNVYFKEPFFGKTAGVVVTLISYLWKRL